MQMMQTSICCAIWTNVFLGDVSNLSPISSIVLLNMCLLPSSLPVQYTTFCFQPFHVFINCYYAWKVHCKTFPYIYNNTSCRISIEDMYCTETHVPMVFPRQINSADNSRHQQPVCKIGVQQSQIQNNLMQYRRQQEVANNRGCRIQRMNTANTKARHWI